MSILGTYRQQPDEKLDYDVDYADWLEGSDALLSKSVTISPTGPTISSAIVGERIKTWVSGGTAGVKYKVTVTATTSSGRIKQDEFYIKCKEL